MNYSRQRPTSKRRSPFSAYFIIWVTILSLYVLVLVGIGQVAFTKQYFNDADTMVGDFLEVKRKFELNDDDEATDKMINAIIERSVNSAGDLQELASQSFNIVLGALLAFLSASATIIFQRWSDRNDANMKAGTSMAATPVTKDPTLVSTEEDASALTAHDAVEHKSAS